MRGGTSRVKDLTSCLSRKRSVALHPKYRILRLRISGPGPYIFSLVLIPLL